MKRFVRVRTKNYTARPLRGSILVDDFAIVRLGSLTPTGRVFPGRKDILEINTVESVQNSRNKLLMKNCFTDLKIPQAEWWASNREFNGSELPYPVVIKRVYGFQGRGMELIRNEDELIRWLRHNTFNDQWFIEKFYNYATEYRLHVAKNIGCFLAWRKLRTKEATNRWFFNSENSNWVGIDHKLFNKPPCWKEMEKAALDCLTSTGLDLGAVDIRVQSSKKSKPQFIVCEINSAPALGELGIEKYKEVIKQLISAKNV